MRRGKFSLSGPKWEPISAEAKDFIRELLVYSPDKRMSVREALQHPWLLTARNADVELKLLPPNVVPTMRRFSHLHGWKKAVLEAVAFTASDTDGELGSLRSAFQKCDKSGTGHIDLEEFQSTIGKGGVGPEEAERLFRSCTTDNRETITYTDWLAATIPRGYLTRKVLKKAFDALDMQGNGYLTLQGMLGSLGSEFNNRHLEDLFGALDDKSTDAVKKVYFDNFFESFFFRSMSEEIVDEPTPTPRNECP